MCDITTIYLQKQLIFPTWNSVPIKHLPTPSPRSSLYEFTPLGTLYKRNYTVLVFSWLAYFTERSALKVQPCYSRC